MIQLSLPSLVRPPSRTVPVLMVQHSRMVIAITDFQSSQFTGVFLSCGAEPTEANWKILLSRPIVVTPLNHDVRADFNQHPDRNMFADDAIRAPLTSAASLAPGWITAVDESTLSFALPFSNHDFPLCRKMTYPLWLWQKFPYSARMAQQNPPVNPGDHRPSPDI